MDAAMQAVYDLLPATGEISYDQWKAAIVAEGHYGRLPLTQKLRQFKHVKFRNEWDGVGVPVPMVSRAVQEGGGDANQPSA